jgi:hypothetical protein
VEEEEEDAAWESTRTPSTVIHFSTTRKWSVSRPGIFTLTEIQRDVYHPGGFVNCKKWSKRDGKDKNVCFYVRTNESAYHK